MCLMFVFLSLPPFRPSLPPSLPPSLLPPLRAFLHTTRLPSAWLPGFDILTRAHLDKVRAAVPESWVTSDQTFLDVTSAD